MLDEVAVSSINMEDKTDSTTTLIDTTTLISPNIYVRVKGGESGEIHKITILATTNQNHVREIDVLLQIREL